MQTGPVSFTAHIMRGLVNPILDSIAPVEGATVEFVGYKDGSSTYRVLATGTVHGDVATARWQPAEADNGTYHVTALLYGSILGPLLPYAASTQTDPPQVTTVDVTVAVQSLTPPQKPTNLTIAQPSASTMWLKWRDNADNEDGYIVYGIQPAFVDTVALEIGRTGPERHPVRHHWDRLLSQLHGRGIQCCWNCGVR